MFRGIFAPFYWCTSDLKLSRIKPNNTEILQYVFCNPSRHTIVVRPKIQEERKTAAS